MRKVLCICSVLLILVLSAVPAFATGGSGGAIAQLRRAPIKFDSFRFESGSQMFDFPYPFNSGYIDGHGVFEYENGMAYGDMSVSYSDSTVDKPILSGSLLLPAASPSSGNTSTVTFYGSSQVIDTRFIDNFVLSVDPSALRIHKVRIVGGYYFLDPSTIDSNYYTSDSETFIFEVDVINGRVQIGKALKDYLSGVSSNSPYWFLNDLSVSIEFSRLSVDTTRFEISTYVGNTAAFHNWVYSEKNLYSRICSC